MSNEERVFVPDLIGRKFPLSGEPFHDWQLLDDFFFLHAQLSDW